MGYKNPRFPALAVTSEIIDDRLVKVHVWNIPSILEPHKKGFIFRVYIGRFVDDYPKSDPNEWMAAAEVSAVHHLLTHTRAFWLTGQDNGTWLSANRPLTGKGLEFYFESYGLIKEALDVITHFREARRRNPNKEEFPLTLTATTLINRLDQAHIGDITEEIYDTQKDVTFVELKDLEGSDPKLGLAVNRSGLEEWLVNCPLAYQEGDASGTLYVSGYGMNRVANFMGRSLVGKSPLKALAKRLDNNTYVEVENQSEYRFLTDRFTKEAGVVETRVLQEKGARVFIVLVLRQMGEAENENSSIKMVLTDFVGMTGEQLRRAKQAYREHGADSLMVEWTDGE
jgi:hypothetical protein